MGLLPLPTQKILAKYLRCCTRSAALSSNDECLWKCQLGSRCFTILPIVWIQGIVIQVMDECKRIIVDDGTGIIILLNDKVSSKLSVTKGMYIMAVGTLQSGGEHPVINSKKLQDLSNTDHAESMWFLEVIDQMNFMKS